MQMGQMVFLVQAVAGARSRLEARVVAQNQVAPCYNPPYLLPSVSAPSAALTVVSPPSATLRGGSTHLGVRQDGPGGPLTSAAHFPHHS